MFKKEVDFKPQKVLKVSERKKLQQLINHPLPETVSRCQFQCKDGKGLMYFDLNKGDAIYFQWGETLIPSVSSLILYPEFHHLPLVQTHQLVIDRLINGADLMIRGCVNQLPAELKNGGLCAVVDYKSPLVPIGVGVCMMDVAGLEWNQYKDMRGVIVKMVTVLGDLVKCRVGGVDNLLEERRTRKNDDELLKELGLKEEGDGDEEEEEEEDDDDDENENEIETNIVNEKESKDKVEPDEVKKETDQQQNDANTGKIGSNDNEVSFLAEETYRLTIEDIDQFFERSLLYTISQDNIQLPIKSTQLIESHIIRNLPQCDLTIVNLKKSSWKKGTKFLKAMEKKGLLKLKGKDDNLTIVAFASREDSRIANFHPYKIRAIPKPVGINNGSSGSNSSTIGAKDDDILLKTLFKPTNPARQMYNTLDLQYDSFYNQQEITAHIQQYIKQADLVDPSNKQQIVPNEILREMGVKSPIKRSLILPLLMTKFSPYYLLYKNGDSQSTDPLIQKRLVPKKGIPPKIIISIEKLKVGKKFITRIGHCELFFIDPQNLAAQLRVKCMGSTNIVESENAKEGKEVIVQGRHDTTIINILKGFGVKESWCQISDNVKNKRR